MSDKDFRISAIKYYELHGLDKDHPYPRSEGGVSEFEFGSLPVLSWWRNRVEKTYAKYKGYSDSRIPLSNVSFFPYSFPLFSLVCLPGFIGSPEDTLVGGVLMPANPSTRYL